MEKENSGGAVQGDGQSVVQAKKVIIDILSNEQSKVPTSSEDWMVLEDMKESVRIEANPQVIYNKLKMLSEILETMSAENLASKTSV